MLAVRTGFLLMLAFRSGCFISCEQPGGSVMFHLHIFQVLSSMGCHVTKFCFCGHGSGFQKASKWLHNKNWYLSLEAQCKCPYKGQRFTVQGSFTRAAIALFNQRCRPNTMSVYGHERRASQSVFSILPPPLVRGNGCRKFTGSQVDRLCVPSGSCARSG